MLKTFIVLIIFKSALTQDKDCAEENRIDKDKDKQICRQLAKFTPNLCEIDIANRRCVEQCGDNSGAVDESVLIDIRNGKPKKIGSRIIFPSDPLWIVPGGNRPSSKKDAATALDCGVKLIDDTRRKKKLRMNTKKDLLKRIVGGTITEEGEWPWQVLLRGNDSDSNNPFICGGAILSQHFILTAAHCRYSKVDFPKYVYVGEHERNITKANEKVHNIKKRIPHENYRGRLFNNAHDIAILQLEEPISLEDENKARLCLPDNEHPIGEMQECNVTGWGRTQYGGHTSQRLREVQVMRVPRRICNLPQIYNGSVHESSLCAGDTENGGVDSCQGDSGGPLSCRNSDTDLWYSIGVVSWGRGCGAPNALGVYADTLYHKEWIVKTILDKSDPLD